MARKEGRIHTMHICGGLDFGGLNPRHQGEERVGYIARRPGGLLVCRGLGISMMLLLHLKTLGEFLFTFEQSWCWCTMPLGAYSIRSRPRKPLYSASMCRQPLWSSLRSCDQSRLEDLNESLQGQTGKYRVYSAPPDIHEMAWISIVERVSMTDLKSFERARRWFFFRVEKCFEKSIVFEQEMRLHVRDCVY